MNLRHKQDQQNAFVSEQRIIVLSNLFTRNLRQDKGITPSCLLHCTKVYQALRLLTAASHTAWIQPWNTSTLATADDRALSSKILIKSFEVTQVHMQFEEAALNRKIHTSKVLLKHKAASSINTKFKQKKPQLWLLKWWFPPPHPKTAIFSKCDLTIQLSHSCYFQRSCTSSKLGPQLEKPHIAVIQWWSTPVPSCFVPIKIGTSTFSCWGISAIL